MTRVIIIKLIVVNDSEYFQTDDTKIIPGIILLPVQTGLSWGGFATKQVSKPLFHGYLCLAMKEI
ncbi:hypothetical protein CK934_23400 [Chitinophaga sp. MD30]|nr:hypothetical protein CK934_23400 [Chitinophaga sp. MD30]